MLMTCGRLFQLLDLPAVKSVLRFWHIFSWVISLQVLSSALQSPVRMPRTKSQENIGTERC